MISILAAGIKFLIHFQTLREAKEVYEAEAQQEAEFVEARKAHFGSLFDEYNGK